MRFDAAQLSVEVLSGLRVVRTAGVLDRRTVDRLADLVVTQLTRSGCAGHIVVDLGEVSFFATHDLDALHTAGGEARAAGVRLYVAGVSSREALLPASVARALAEFSAFPTVEQAERELAGQPVVVATAGGPRSSYGWPCPPGSPVDDGRNARSGSSLRV